VILWLLFSPLLQLTCPPMSRRTEATECGHLINGSVGDAAKFYNNNCEQLGMAYAGLQSDQPWVSMLENIRTSTKNRDWCPSYILYSWMFINLHNWDSWGASLWLKHAHDPDIVLVRLISRVTIPKASRLTREKKCWCYNPINNQVNALLQSNVMLLLIQLTWGIIWGFLWLSWLIITMIIQWLPNDYAIILENITMLFVMIIMIFFYDDRMIQSAKIDLASPTFPTKLLPLAHEIYG